MKIGKSKKAQGIEVTSQLGSWIWFVILLVVLVIILLYAFGPKLMELAKDFVSRIGQR